MGRAAHRRRHAPAADHGAGAQAQPALGHAGRAAPAPHPGAAAREERPARRARSAGRGGADRRAGVARARSFAGAGAEVAGVRHRRRGAGAARAAPARARRSELVRVDPEGREPAASVDRGGPEAQEMAALADDAAAPRCARRDLSRRRPAREIRRRGSGRDAPERAGQSARRVVRVARHRWRAFRHAVCTGARAACGRRSRARPWLRPMRCNC